MSTLAKTILELIVTKEPVPTHKKEIVKELKQIIVKALVEHDAGLALTFSQNSFKDESQVVGALNQLLSTDNIFKEKVTSYINRFIIEDESKVENGNHLPLASINGSMSAQGHLVIASDSNVRISGIQAGKIEADNVVSGIQSRGILDPNALIALSRNILSNRISADEIQAKDVVSGVQLFNSGTPETAEELYKEIALLREEILKLGKSDHVDIEGLCTSLDEAGDELEKDSPDENTVIETLESTAKALTIGSDIAAAAGKLGSNIFKLAPIASALWKIAQKIFVHF